MELRRTFRLDEEISLPRDMQILQYDPNLVQSSDLSGGCSGCSGSECDSGSWETSRFIAASPRAGSYIVLDKELLPCLRQLANGASLRDVRNELRSRLGGDIADRRFDTLLRNIVGRNFFDDAAVIDGDPTAPVMQMYVTNKCNLRCRHCYMSSGEPLPQGEITTEDRLRIISIFSRLAPNSKITFTGGEALLDPDIFDIFAHAKMLGLKVELFSNGLTIKNDDIAAMIVEHVDILQISIDGATSEINDAIRGYGTFAKIIRGVRLIDDAIYRVGKKVSIIDWQ